MIAELRARASADGLIRLPPRMRTKFRRGERVRIVGWVLQGKLAIFDGMRSHERVAVLLSLLGRQQRFELNAQDIEGTGTCTYKFPV